MDFLGYHELRPITEALKFKLPHLLASLRLWLLTDVIMELENHCSDKRSNAWSSRVQSPS